MFEEQFKGYQLKGFTFQAHLDFSDDVFQICVIKCIVRGNLQKLLSVSFPDEWPLFLYLPSHPLGLALISAQTFIAKDLPTHSPRGDKMVATDWVWVTACL